MQYGGGDRPDSFSDLLHAFFNPSSYDNTIGGNRRSSATRSRRSRRGSFSRERRRSRSTSSTRARTPRRSATSGSATPRCPPASTSRCSARTSRSSSRSANGRTLGTFTRSIRTGLRNEDHVIGHWGGDWRMLGDGVGARSWMVQVAWEPKFGGLVEGTYRSLDNQLYSAQPYVPGSNFDLRYTPSVAPIPHGRRGQLRPRRVRRGLFARQRLPALLGP